MKSKTFRLQSVLDLRAAAVEEAENKLRHALLALEQARARVLAARQEAETVANQMCHLHGNVSAGTHQQHRLTYRAQVARIDELQAQVDLRLQEVHACRQRLVQAKKDHDILLRLRDNWLKATAKEEARKEESLLNDLINARHFRFLHASGMEFQSA